MWCFPPTELETQWNVARYKYFAPDGAKASRAGMIEIVNRQRQRKIRPKECKDFAEESLRALGKREHSATIVFVGDEAIKKLSRRFRGKDYATDVLSFPTVAEAFEVENQTHLGEVVISAQRAAAQARRNGLSFENEVRQLILHGLLHLCGYDHETDNGEMNRLELRLRKQLEI